MTSVYSKALDARIEVDRIIGEIEGKPDGPCLIFFGGVHGNEPAGVFALNRLFRELKESNTTLQGLVIGLAGNLWALERSKRYHKQDLNRLWNSERMEALSNGSFVPCNEDEKQQADLFRILQDRLAQFAGPFYFFDLHTTSSPTTPFLTVNDSLLNRRFTQQYPVPIILGIEEYLDGPLLSYINELGFVSFGFESGQHDDLSAIENHLAFAYLSLVFTGAINKESIDFERYFKFLGSTTGDFYEIFHRHEIQKGESFKMEAGFVNFQSISKGQLLAHTGDRAIRAFSDSKIFMPLYQKQGNDGFFKIRRIKPFYLHLSAWLRKWKCDRLFPLLPGVRRSTKGKNTLVVNLKIARIFTKQFLHLFGYRSKRKDDNHLIIKNREEQSRSHEYIALWNKES